MYRNARPAIHAATAASRSTVARRHASTQPSPIRRSLGTLTLVGGSVALVAYYYDSRSLLHEHLIMPAVRSLTDAEESHRLAVRMLSMGGWARPKDKVADDERLGAMLWNKRLDNPVGVAAGFDKDAEAIDGLFDLGFGYVEVGSVTPEPQPGNPKPRFFRLPEDSAVINRYGFNSSGHRQTLHRLQTRLRLYAESHPSEFPGYNPSDPLAYRDLVHNLPEGLPKSLRPGRLLAVNLGKNKTSKADDHEDYVKGVKMLGPYADVIVVNVSSPNTPGLRGLQRGESLYELLSQVVGARDNLPSSRKQDRAKVVVKIAPDLEEEEIEGIARAVRQSGVEGVIVSNTTVKREGLGLISAHQNETGGLSGPPVKPLAILALKTLRPLLPPSIPIIGCGGITTGEDALEYAKAGASVVQAYTAFGYKGVGFARGIKDELVDSFNRNNLRGESSWAGVVKQSTDAWAKGVEEVGKDLVKLGERIRSGESRIPWEDLVAERGMGGQQQRQQEGESKAKAIPFGESGGSNVSSKDSPFAPASANGEGVVPAVTRQLTDFLGRAQAVVGQGHVRSVATSSASPSTGTGTVPTLNETVESGSGVQEAEPEDTRPAIQRESRQLAWVNEVTRGNRRMV